MVASDKSADAFLNLGQQQYAKDIRHITVTLGDKTYKLARLEGGSYPPDVIPIAGIGGTKRVYDLGNGTALMLFTHNLPRTMTETTARKLAGVWERIIREEKETSDKLSKLGFETQNIAVTELTIGNGQMPVMLTTPFKDLAAQGRQIRDIKNPNSSCGHSMLFGTPENLENPERLKLVMQGVLDDTVKLITHGLSFDMDACNLIIRDTAQTPMHNPNDPDLFDHRKQQARLFFFDLSSKHGPRNDAKLPLLDAAGNPDPIQVRKYAEYGVCNAFTAIRHGITNEEKMIILNKKSNYSSGHTYNDKYALGDVIDGNYKLVKDAMIDDVSSRVVAEISRMPGDKRFELFSPPEKIPPIALPGNGNPQEILIQAPSKANEQRM